MSSQETWFATISTLPAVRVERAVHARLDVEQREQAGGSSAWSACACAARRRKGTRRASSQALRDVQRDARRAPASPARRARGRRRHAAATRASPELSSRKRAATTSRSSAWFWPPREPILIEPSSDASRPLFCQSQRCDMPYSRPGAVRVAATGRIDELGGRHGGHVDRRAVGVDARAFAAQRDDERVDAPRERLFGKPGALAQQLRLVVVHRHDGRAVDHLDQLVAAEQRHALAGIEDVRDARRAKLARRAAACRRDRPARRCRARRRARRPRAARASAPSRPDGTR